VGGVGLLGRASAGSTHTEERGTMKSASEIAQRASENYRLLKAQLVVASEADDDNCVPIMEIHRGETIKLMVLADRSLLPQAIVAAAEQDGPEITACVFNAEVYTSHVEGKEKKVDQSVYLDDPQISEGLLTVAVTIDGDFAVKLFNYEHLDDGGLFFNEVHIEPSKLGTMVYEMKGLFAQHERKG
jgi:hypothetical protein